MSNLIPVNDLQVMASAIAKSQLFGAKSPDQALALMLVAQAEGMHPAIAARDYDIISGRPAKKSEAMLRDFLAAGGKVEWHSLSDTLAAATFSHPAGGTVRIDWDMKRAAQAGLSGKDMWKKYPRNMLRARCVSEGVRTVCPSATSGMHAPEEANDMGEAPVPPLTRPDPIDMGAAVVVPALSEVLAKIEAADSPDALDAIVDDIRKLLGEERHAAIAAAKAKEATFSQPETQEAA